ncbi:cobyric acid synthase [Gordonia amarae]|uniref:Cobyric acid synthase n=1 Tax=Gordonia amarae TaxID=36821 RepID=A0A857LLB2_9ACTN|nr:cobyric acid synthase [Gordonia amarae]MCS3878689.1 adenosylcobyric acid synthase [Gordonia amarae]QHN17277.1 cobyric acid synthase [Gordonia amarae]QHN21803.1 cobyric acid synthase [Gordonia amarae]QHN30653.1 cobyric acid synthase [Gordonia amarae]QHN39430.1 cobyric acid synthase [Gordonia amarae]
MSGVNGALLVGGATSDAGKSMIVTGLCRALARQGIRVAPFKAQNMSNNSAITPDGGEIGRAQALQAFACGLDPSTRFNPVLLKPGSDRRSHVVVRGRPDGQIGAADYATRRAQLLGVVTDELASLRADFDIVICEGAGSIAEINLRGSDIANMGLAQAGAMPVIVVSDIDRGGSLAHLFGTTAVLGADDQRLVAGYLINKFRGDPGLLAPGLEQLRELTGRPTYGVVPYASGIWIDAEDSLSVAVGRRVGPPAADGRPVRLSVAAIRLPRISNSTDVEALACEPGVDVAWVDDAGAVAAADIAILPGTRATVSDLAWLRSRGIDAALRGRAAAGRPVIGICGGFQMLGRTIDDDVESGGGRVEGLGLLDMTIRFDADKITKQVTGHADVRDGRVAVRGYEIHHGRVDGCTEDAWIRQGDNLIAEGAVRGAVRGTHWHGLLENNAFRRDLLITLAEQAGKPAFEVAPDTDVAAIRTGQVDLIADLLTAHVDLDALLDIIGRGAGASVPVITHMLTG